MQSTCSAGLIYRWYLLAAFVKHFSFLSLQLMAPPMADNNIRLVLLNRRRLICIAAFASLFCSFGNLILIQTFSSRPQSTPDSCYRWPIEPLQAEPHIAHVLPGSSHRHLIIYSFSSFSLLLEKSFSIHFFLSWDSSTTIGQISTLSTWFKLKYFSIQLFENLVNPFNYFLQFQ